MKFAMLTNRLILFIEASWALSTRRSSNAPTTGRNMTVLNIGNPVLFIIICSIIRYLNSIRAAISNTPIAIIVA